MCEQGVLSVVLVFSESVLSVLRVWSWCSQGVVLVFSGCGLGVLRVWSGCPQCVRGVSSVFWLESSLRLTFVFSIFRTCIFKYMRYILKYVHVISHFQFEVFDMYDWR